MGWYNKVNKDIINIPLAIDYYEQELISAKKECGISGLIEKASAAMPGIVEHRYCQLQEIDAILEYLNIEHRRIKSKVFRKYLETYQRALSSRDCDKYAESDDEVVDFEKLVNEFALLRNKWLGITKALDQKSFSLNNIIKLRCAGLEDATL
jgi:hypothetical protein